MNLFDSAHFTLSAAVARQYFNVSVTLLIAILLDNLLKSWVKVPKKLDSQRARTYVTIFRNIITVLVYVVALHVIFVELGINITPLLTSAGIIGVILGISARPVLEDFITGIFLISQHSIAIGDYVKIDDAEGTIETIGFRTMTIRDFRGALYIIPNGQIKKVINFSRHKATVLVDVPVKVDQNIDDVLEAAEKALVLLQKDHEVGEAISEKSYVMGIDDMKDNGMMMIRTAITTTPAIRWRASRIYRYLIKKEFEKNKIKMF